MRLVTLLILFLFAPTVSAFLPSSEEDYYRVIMIDGKELASTLGKALDKLSLFSVIDGVLEPVPFQIDEYNIGGGVFFEEWQEPIDGTRGIMDDNDKLIALYGDSGPRKTPTMLVDGDILAEIELQTRDGAKRYFYVVEGSRLTFDAQHVRHSLAASRVETDFFSLTYDKENQLIWKDFRFADFQGESPVDGLKIAFESGVLSSTNTLKYDNENFIAKTIAENVGPIRTTAQLHLTFVLLGLDFIEASIQLHFYPNALIYDVRLIMPETRRAMLVNPQLTMSIDFNNLIGARGYTDALAQPLVVDGTMSDREQEANNIVLSQSHNGLVLQSDKGFAIATFLNWIHEIEADTTLYYLDDPEFSGKVDRFKGRLPDAGYRVTNLPKTGLLGFIASIYFSNSFQGKPYELSRVLRAVPDIKINY